MRRFLAAAAGAAVFALAIAADAGTAASNAAFLLPAVPIHRYTPHLQLAWALESPITAMPPATPAAKAKPVARHTPAAGVEGRNPVGGAIAVGTSMSIPAHELRAADTSTGDGIARRRNWNSGGLVSIAVALGTRGAGPGLILGCVLVLGLLLLRRPGSVEPSFGGEPDALEGSTDLPDDRATSVADAAAEPERLSFALPLHSPATDARAVTADAAPDSAVALALRQRASAVWRRSPDEETRRRLRLIDSYLDLQHLAAAEEMLAQIEQEKRRG